MPGIKLFSECLTTLIDLKTATAYYGFALCNVSGPNNLEEKFFEVTPILKGQRKIEKMSQRPHTTVC